MNREEAKKEKEISVFLEFIERSGLQIDQQSVENREPPEPDILCRDHRGHQIAFELAELCDPKIAQQFNLKEKDIPNVREFWTEDPSPKVLRQKLAKQYQTKHPIYLLCYTRERLITPDNVATPTLSHIIETEGAGIYHSIWFMGETETAMIFKDED